ncbi:hypothetical protein ILP92_03730 [Maribius pontilimi]|uniref:Uncharacterized protein n=1 Tax=Palleronia pontilimi TaxID=1964209 RepID=A0A934I7U9_9RHOB|nr:hypothetical protein [Palleronia pontilimi]MBJ3761858.1 hypothetical protein [Palleronia pontilimi]
MNVNRMIGFFLRRVMHHGINAGIDSAFGGAKDPKDMTPEERKKHQAAKQNAKRSKQALRMMRRFGRF